ncbi:MAG: hypothetical protein ACI9WC_000419 [Arenicella sp.]|jgi:uncharacterized protein YcbX
MKPIKISQLSVYPVKSANGNAVSTMWLDGMGPKWDRRWMVVDANFRFTTQRKFAQMCHIKTKLSGDSLSLSAPGAGSITLDDPSTGDHDVVVWRDTVQAQDCGDAAAQWLSDYLGRSCRLVFMADETRRLVNPEHAKKSEIVSFADGYPILIVSSESLDLLNSKLDNDVLMDRFRPNIVVTGCAPHAEDQWKRIKIGQIEMSLVSACSRCIMPSIDQQTGNKNQKVLDALQEYRRCDREIYFGMNAIHHSVGEIKLGDQLTILE